MFRTQIDWEAYKPSGKLYDCGLFFYDLPLTFEGLGSDTATDVYISNDLHMLEQHEAYVRYLSQGFDVRLEFGGGMLYCPILLRGWSQKAKS